MTQKIYLTLKDKFSKYFKVIKVIISLSFVYIRRNKYFPFFVISFVKIFRLTLSRILKETFFIDWKPKV